MNGGYITLDNLFIYKIALELCDTGWKIYGEFDWKEQKIMGDQFIRAVDSVAANIAEGYGRFHYLDKIKFYYIARASLLESKHWVNLMRQREKVEPATHEIIIKLLEQIHYELNKFIKSTYQAKQQK